MNGVCVRQTASCDYKTCSNGCCAADGCKQPFTDQFCGIGGQGCRSCDALDTCIAGYCQPKALGCALSCLTGCCVGDQCLTFDRQTAQLCGNSGQACRACDLVRGEICDQSQGVCNVRHSGKCPNCIGVDQCCNDQNQCVSGESNLQCGSKGEKCQNCSLAPFGPQFSCQNNLAGLNSCDDGGGGTKTVCVEAVKVRCKADTAGNSNVCQQDLDEPGGPPLGFEVHVKVGLLTRETASAVANWDQNGTGLAQATFVNECPHGGVPESDLQKPITLGLDETDPGVFNADESVVVGCVMTVAAVQAGVASGRADVVCPTIDGGSSTITLLFR